MFAKKSHNIINIISLIALTGIVVGVTALVIVLSVFNGFDSLIKGMYSSINPDLKIFPVEGKVFTTASPEFDKLRTHPGVAAISQTMEENAIFSFGAKKHIGTIKGVDTYYTDVCRIDSLITEGEFTLGNNAQPFAVLGCGVAYHLEANLSHLEPMMVYIPKRGKSALSMQAAFARQAIMPAAICAVEQEFDMQYVIAPIEFVRQLLQYDTTIVTALEIKTAKGYSSERLQKDIQNIIGKKYKIQNRYQQNESLYRTMKTEKLVIGLILVLILIIASFNIVGSLSMLIIEKRDDVDILRSLGADNKLIQKIFLKEGMLISFAGTFIGTVLGLILCWIQIVFQVIRLDSRGNFIIDAYPVDIRLLDIAIIVAVVLIIGYLCARIPVQLVTKKILKSEKNN